MVDRLRWKPDFRAYQCGSTEEVLCLRLWLQDGWPSFQLALHLITFIDILDCSQPIETHEVCYNLFFSIAMLIISIPGLGPFDVQLCFARKVSRALYLQAYLSHLFYYHLTSPSVTFHYFSHLLYLGFHYWSLHFIFSSLRMLIFHILMHGGQSYHPFHSIIQH